MFPKSLSLEHIHRSLTSFEFSYKIQDEVEEIRNLKLKMKLKIFEILAYKYLKPLDEY
jgi:hypothetical protein